MVLAGLSPICNGLSSGSKTPGTTLKSIGHEPKP